jgi:drug/metabolite transporter (DMT)-like permease
VPDRILRPRPLMWVEYALLITAGLLFQLTADSESVTDLVSDFGNAATAAMLVAGGLIGVFGSVSHRYEVELAAYPFLVGVWVVYAIAVAHAAFTSTAPLGFAALLGAGAAGLAGRGTELWHAIKVSRELALRQAQRDGNGV